MERYTMSDLSLNIRFRYRTRLPQQAYALFRRGDKIFTSPSHGCGLGLCLNTPSGSKFLRHDDRFKSPEEAEKIIAARNTRSPIIKDETINNMLKGELPPTHLGDIQGRDRFEDCETGPVFAGYFLVELLQCDPYLETKAELLIGIYQGLDLLNIENNPNLIGWDEYGREKFVAGMLANLFYQLQSSPYPPEQRQRAAALQNLRETAGLLFKSISGSPAWHDWFINLVVLNITDPAKMTQKEAGQYIKT